MKLLPFASVTSCPACGREMRDYTVKYSTDRVVAVGNGLFASVSTVTDPPCPHLQKRCRCGWGWLEEVREGDRVDTTGA